MKTSIMDYRGWLTLIISGFKTGLATLTAPESIHAHQAKWEPARNNKTESDALNFAEFQRKVHTGNFLAGPNGFF